MLLKVRNDDVLVHSSAFFTPGLENRPDEDYEPTKRLVQLHTIIAKYNNVMHVPAILTDDIQKRPGAIDFVKQETKLHRMQPEVHGKTHINYNTRERGIRRDSDPRTWTAEETKAAKEWVTKDIREARDWIATTFGRTPKYWYTPWGAEALHLYEVAYDLNLILVGTKVNYNPIRNVYTKLESGQISADRLNGLEIFLHWWDREWDRHNRLERICATFEYGSWENAKSTFPKVFRD